MDGEWRHEIDLADHGLSVSEARAFVTVHLVDHDLEPLVDDLRQVVSELATNALKHAHTGFEVVLREAGGRVRLEVYDGSADLPVLVSAHDLDTGGRGVAIVDNLSRDWGAVRQGRDRKSVWAEFDRPAAG